MQTTLLLHIIAGMLALVFGYLALYAAKGGTVHRKAGRGFVYAMLTMAVGGVMMSIGRGVAPTINIPAGLLAAYLVITALTTVRPPASGGRWLDRGSLLVALAIGLGSVVIGMREAAAGRGGMAFPLFMFGTVALLASVGDLRVVRFGALRGAPRIARHLWRMCFALFLAAMSFFIGQAKNFPEPIRIPALLAVPVLMVLVTMVYWMWRVRSRRSVRGLVGVAASELP